MLGDARASLNDADTSSRANTRGLVLVTNNPLWLEGRTVMSKLIVIREREPEDHEPDSVLDYIAHHVRHAMNTGDSAEMNTWLDLLFEVAETRAQASVAAWLN